MALKQELENCATHTVSQHMKERQKGIHISSSQDALYFEVKKTDPLLTIPLARFP